MKAKKYRLRKYIAVFKCRATPDITLTGTFCARTKSEAMLYVGSVFDDVLGRNGITLRLPNSDFWELISLKWARPVRPFDLSINNQ